MNINTLFNLLDDWGCLPAYQLERRADIFFALHLKEILKKKYQIEIDEIIPEFPLRIGGLPNQNPNTNSSFKIDYLAYSEKASKVFLIELKTDVESKRPEQEKYFNDAKTIKLKAIIDGIIKIYGVTRQRKKYDHLMLKLINIGWIEKNGREFKNLANNIVPTTIYMLPYIDENKKIDNQFDEIITFQNIIDNLKNDSNTELTKRFLESLEKWKTNLNIKK